MVREIKFRGISSIEGHWIYGSLVCYADVLNIIDEAGDEWVIEPNSQGQFLGLKYKKGAEIFEGDIVNFDKRDHYNPYVIKWGEGGFIMVSKKDTDLHVWQNSIEVIGNIFENQELL